MDGAKRYQRLNYANYSGMIIIGIYNFNSWNWNDKYEVSMLNLPLEKIWKLEAGACIDEGKHGTESTKN